VPTSSTPPPALPASGVIQAAKGRQPDVDRCRQANQNYIAPGLRADLSAESGVDVTVHDVFQKPGDAGFKAGTVTPGCPRNRAWASPWTTTTKPLITADAQSAVDAATKGIGRRQRFKVHDYNADNQCP